MTEWVVTLRDGRRIDVESERYEARVVDGVTVHCFTGPPRSPTYGDRVTLVQRRDGHLLEQVWPAR